MHYERCPFTIINDHIASDLSSKLKHKFNTTDIYPIRNPNTFNLLKRNSNIRFKCPSIECNWSRIQIFNHIDIHVHNPISLTAFKLMLMSNNI